MPQVCFHIHFRQKCLSPGSPFKKKQKKKTHFFPSRLLSSDILDFSFCALIQILKTSFSGTFASCLECFTFGSNRSLTKECWTPNFLEIYSVQSPPKKHWNSAVKSFFCLCCTLQTFGFRVWGCIWGKGSEFQLLFHGIDILDVLNTSAQSTVSLHPLFKWAKALEHVTDGWL